MAVTNYPNITIDSTTFTLLAQHNNLTLVSTQGSAGNVVATSQLPAGFDCWIIQMGAGVITATASAGAAVNGLGGTVVTGGQYGAMHIIAQSDGNFVVTAVS